MGIVAFLPRQAWLDNSRLAPVFLTAAHGGSHVVPFDLGEKIRQGLQALRIAQPDRAGFVKESRKVHFATAMQPILRPGFLPSMVGARQTQTRRSSG
jgi:hypothetical protein